MKSIFSIGDKKQFVKRVLPEDTATFESGNVHPFYATFALGRDAEWCCRLFVLDMKEADEEGIGTFLNITHKSPAMEGEEVVITAEITGLERNSVDCKFEVKVKDRLIAVGTQGQKILKKEKVKSLINGILEHGSH